MRAARLLVVGMLAVASSSVAQSDRYGNPPKSNSPDFSKLFGDIPTTSGNSGYNTPSAASPAAKSLFESSTPNTGGAPAATQPPTAATRAATTAPAPQNDLRAAPTPSSAPTASLRGSPTGSTTRPNTTAAAPASPATSADSFRSLGPPPSAASPSPTAAAQPRGGVAPLAGSAVPPARSPAVPTGSGTRQPLTPRADLGTTGTARALTTPPPRTQAAPPARRAAVAQMGLRERQTRQTLAKMLERHPRSRLVGSPLSLSSAVASATTREQQAALVDAYWTLTSTVADYYLGLAEVDEVGRLLRQSPTFTVLSNEQEELQTRVDTSLRAARAAQMRLARLMGNPSASPLPSDMPFTGPYRTRIDSVFAGAAPGEARLLNELIPLRLAELQGAAEAVYRSEQWVKQVKDDSRNTNGAGVVRALELLALNRRAFVQLTRDYNLQINRYTQLVAPERVDTPQLVAMLIRTQPTLATGDNSFVAGANSERSLTTPRR